MIEEEAIVISKDKEFAEVSRKVKLVIKVELLVKDMFIALWNSFIIFYLEE